MGKMLSQYKGLKTEIYILFIGRLVTAMGAFIWPILTFFLTTNLSMSDGKATLLIATATVFSFPVALLGGKLADRFSRKTVIVLFDLLTVSLYFLAASLPFSLLTAVLLFLAGLFQLVETGAYDAINADFSTTSQREKAFSLSYLGYNLGYIVGATMSGLLFEKHLRLALCLNGSFVLFSTMLILLFVHTKNAIVEDRDSLQESYSVYEQPVDEKTPVLQILRQRPVLIGMLLIGCFIYMPNNLVGILLPLQLKQALGAGGATIYGYLGSLSGFVVIVCTPVLTILLRRLTELPKTALGLALFAAGMGLFSLQAAVAVLFVGMFVFTVGEVITVLGSTPYYSHRVPASHRGRIGGIVTVINSVCTSVTQFAAGLLLMVTNSNFRLLWTIFILCIGTVALLHLALYSPDRRQFPALYKKKKEESCKLP